MFCTCLKIAAIYPGPICSLIQMVLSRENKEQHKVSPCDRESSTFMNMNHQVAWISWAGIQHYKTDSYSSQPRYLSMPPNRESNQIITLNENIKVPTHSQITVSLNFSFTFLRIFFKKKTTIINSRTISVGGKLKLKFCNVTHLISYSSSRCGLLAKSYVRYGTICWQYTNSPWTMLRKWHNFRRNILERNK